MTNDFDRILDECIDRINRGEGLEACLADYPAYVEQLEPLLRAMLQTKEAYSFVPSTSTKRAARQHFNAALERLERKRQEKQPLFASVFSWPRAWATVAALVLILLTGYFGLRLLSPAGPVSSPTVTPTQLAGMGMIEIRVTDPPPPGVETAYVTLTKIEVHQASDNVSDNESGWITIIADNVTFNLFEVIDQPDVLGSENVTAGRYIQIRAYVTGVEGLTKALEPYEAEVPSGMLKFVKPFEVRDGFKTILTIDFDGDKSLIMTGEGKFLFRPVVKLLVEYEELP